MHAPLRPRYLILLCLALVASAIQALPQSLASDTDAIKTQVAKYAQSIDAANTTLASQVWLDSPDVSFIHPLGHEHGFAQIKENVYTRLMGETFSERHLSAHDIIVHVYSDSAWAKFHWDFSAKLRNDGSPITTFTSGFASCATHVSCEKKTTRRRTVSKLNSAEEAPKLSGPWGVPTLRLSYCKRGKLFAFFSCCQPKRSAIITSGS